MGLDFNRIFFLDQGGWSEIMEWMVSRVDDYAGNGLVVSS
jgi:hypothetical protein